MKTFDENFTNKALGYCGILEMNDRHLTPGDVKEKAPPNFPEELFLLTKFISSLNHYLRLEYFIIRHHLYEIHSCRNIILQMNCVSKHTIIDYSNFLLNYLSNA